MPRRYAHSCRTATHANAPARSSAGCSRRRHSPSRQTEPIHGQSARRVCARVTAPRIADHTRAAARNGRDTARRHAGRETACTCTQSCRPRGRHQQRCERDGRLCLGHTEPCGPMSAASRCHHRHHHHGRRSARHHRRHHHPHPHSDQQPLPIVANATVDAHAASIVVVVVVVVVVDVVVVVEAMCAPRIGRGSSPL
jgi:hypothetical protein